MSITSPGVHKASVSAPVPYKTGYNGLLLFLQNSGSRGRRSSGSPSAAQPVSESASIGYIRPCLKITGEKRKTNILDLLWFPSSYCWLEHQSWHTKCFKNGVLYRGTGQWKACHFLRSLCCRWVVSLGLTLSGF